MEPTPKEYRLPADDLTTVNKLAIQSGAYLVIVFAAIAWVLEYINRDKTPTPIPAWAIMIPIVAFVIFRQYQKSKNEWRTYRLIIQPDGSLRRTVDALPDVIIAPDEITQIQEVQGTCIMVKSSNALQFIAIPEKLIGLDEVRTHLQTIKPLIQTKPMFPMLQLLVAAAAGFGLVWAAFMQKDQILSIVATSLLLPFIVWVLINNRNDKSITPNEQGIRQAGFIVFLCILLWNMLTRIFPSILSLPNP